MTPSSMQLRKSVATILAIASALTALTASAQSPSSDTSASRTLDAVIVTAQKREQNLQDVPIVVTTVSAQLLQDTGVKDIKDLTLLTSGLLVTSTSSEASTTARIRGIGTVGDNPGLESSVGVVIDGVYRPRNSVGFGDLGEVERIEVLKGPQGTLFGKNTSAGVINVLSKRPSFERESTAEVSAGNYNSLEGSASTTGALIDDFLALRLFGAVRERDGFVDIRTGNGPRTETDDVDRSMYTFRGQLLFTPSDTFDIRVIADYSKRDENCCTGVQVVNASTAAIIAALAAPRGTGTAIPAAPFERVGYANRASDQLIDDVGLSVEMNWDLTAFGGARLTSLSAWRNWEHAGSGDIDYTNADIWYRDTNGNFYNSFTQISEEVRLTGLAGPVNWLIGGFYAHEKLDYGSEYIFGTAFEPYVSLVSSVSAGASASAVALAGWAGMTPGTLYPTGFGQRDVFHQISDTFAIFTNEDIRLTDALELTLGARFTSEDKSLDSNYWNPNGAGSTACTRLLTNVALIPAGARTPALGYGCGTWADFAFDSVTTNQSLDETKLSGTVKLAYRFSDDVMSYVSYGRGYKAGGFNLDRERTNFGVIDRDTSFRQELVDSYELGAKTTWAGNTLVTNASLFYQIYTDFQLNGFNGASFTVSSIPEVTSKGIDADIVWNTPLTGVALQAGVTYAETLITDFGATIGLFAANRMNDRLAHAPTTSANLSITDETPVGNLTLRSNIGVKYNSSYNTGSNLHPLKVQEAYALVNARVGLGSNNELWTVELWAQNLFNEDYYQVMFDAPLQPNGINGFLGAPRTFGLTARMKF